RTNIGSGSSRSRASSAASTNEPWTGRTEERPWSGRKKKPMRPVSRRWSFSPKNTASRYRLRLHRLTQGECVDGGIPLLLFPVLVVDHLLEVGVQLLLLLIQVLLGDIE